MKALLIMSRKDYLTKGNNSKYKLSNNGKIRKKAYELLKEKDFDFITEGVFVAEGNYMNSYKDLDISSINDDEILGVIIDFDEVPKEMMLYNDYYDILRREMKLSPEEFIEEYRVKNVYSSTMHSNCIIDSSIFEMEHRVVDMNSDPFSEEESCQK